MISEIGRGGDWTRAFEAPHISKFDAPTVEGIDFPSMGVRQAWGNPDDVFVICDGEPFDRFTVEGPGTIRIGGDIDSHQYHIFTDYRGGGAPTRDVRRERQTTTGSAALASVQPPARGDAGPNDVRNTSNDFFMDGGPTCSCC